MSRRKQPRFIQLTAALADPPRFVRLLETRRMDPAQVLAEVADLKTTPLAGYENVAFLAEVTSNEGVVLESKAITHEQAAELIGPDHDLLEVLQAALAAQDAPTQMEAA